MTAATNRETKQHTQHFSEREWIMYRMFYLGGNLSSLICTLKSKNLKKP